MTWGWVNDDNYVRPGSIDPMTAVVQRVKGFAYYSLSFSRHNKNIKMEHFFLYILSRYFIWLHKWKGFNDICASLKYERMSMSGGPDILAPGLQLYLKTFHTLKALSAPKEQI